MIRALNREIPQEHISTRASTKIGSNYVDNIIDETDVQQLGEKTILDENGGSIIMSSLWKDQRAVIVFLRHFG